jgi:hypothetical protein
MNDTADKATLKFYDQEAERYAERTGTGSMFRRNGAMANCIGPGGT